MKHMKGGRFIIVSALCLFCLSSPEIALQQKR